MHSVVSLRIRTLPRSSSRSDAVFVPRTSRSRLEAALWLAQHAVAGAALTATGLPFYVKCVLACAVAVSAWWARPRRCSRVVIACDGSWALPDEALQQQVPEPASCYTRWWVRLRLRGPDGRRRVRCLWCDSFDRDDWRRLLILLRECRGGVR